MTERGYRNWLSVMSHSDSEPYPTAGELRQMEANAQALANIDRIERLLAAQVGTTTNNTETEHSNA